MYFDPRLWVFTAGVRGRIWATVAIGLLASVLGVARLALLGWLLGLVFADAPLETLLQTGLLAAAVIVARGGLEYLRLMMAHETAAHVQLHLRALLYDKIVTLGPARLGLSRTGDLLVALVDGIEHLEVYFGKYLPQLFVAAITPLLIFVFVAWLDLPVALVLLAAAAITLVAPVAFHHWDARNSLARAKSYADFAAEFLDSVQGLATLKAFGQSSARARVLKQKAEHLFRTTMWVLATNSLTRGITDAGIAIGAAAALALGAYRTSEGAMSLEVLLVILLMGIEVFRPLRDLRGMLHEGMLARSAADNVVKLLETEPIIAEPADTQDGTVGGSALAFEPSLAFEEVHFSYPGGRGPSHQGLSFTLHAGERVGIVGTSGAGKSTIVRLVQRFYDPDRGRILFGGHDLKDLDVQDIRGHLAVVSQDTYLFHGTVEDNLRFGKPDATREELKAAAQAANAHSFIEALPQGYGTLIGERGLRLSGGQRQRIAIARALLRDAPILVLDEALSSVDAENEAVIQDALDRLMRGRTTLVLAHRLSSVIGCDRILVLDQGRVVEEGSHATLMAQNGAYRRLMGEQAEARTATDAGILFGEMEVVPDEIPENLQEMGPKNEILEAKGLGWSAMLSQLLGFIRPWRAKLVLTFFFGVSRVAAFIGVGLVSALAVAAVKTGDPVFALLAALFALAPAAGILHWLESWVAHDMAFRLLAQMRIDLFRKINALAPAYLVRRRTGDLVSMATNDVELVEYFFAHTIAPAFVAVLVPAAALATLGLFDWRLAAALLPFLAVVGVSPFLKRERIDREASRAREALAEVNAHAVDSVQGLAEVLSFQQEEGRRKEFLASVRQHHRARLPFFRDLTRETAMVEAMTTLGGLAVVLVGADLTAAGAVEARYLPLLTLFAMAAFLPVSEIADIGRQLADTLGATRRLNQVHQEPIPVTDGPEPLAESIHGGAEVIFEDVSFAYPIGQRTALRGASLTLPAGATVALVGPSGAGKTTLAHLLLRFWDPQQGRITLAGHDLRNLKLDDLRQHIALVAQDTYLFNDTLSANIRIARPDAGDEEIAQAVAHAALTDFVASLPDGLDTQVGERGMALSGGQRQRVAIARAFLRNAPILVLDEATSHLDAVSEALVHKALTALMTGRTTLVIAHRLSTVRAADKIVVLDQGRVVEQGNHEDLLAKGGLYARLVRRQMSAGQPRAAE